MYSTSRHNALCLQTLSIAFELVKQGKGDRHCSVPSNAMDADGVQVQQVIMNPFPQTMNKGGPLLHCLPKAPSSRLRPLHPWSRGHKMTGNYHEKCYEATKLTSSLARQSSHMMRCHKDHWCFVSLPRCFQGSHGKRKAGQACHQD